MSVDFHFLNVGYGDCTIIYWPERTAGDKTKNERIMMMNMRMYLNTIKQISGILTVP